jgi:hypothetical protein
MDKFTVTPDTKIKLYRGQIEFFSYYRGFMSKPITIDDYIQESHATAVSKGWWDNQVDTLYCACCAKGPDSFVPNAECGGMKTIQELMLISEMRGHLLPPSYVTHGELRLARAIIRKQNETNL